jgi:hypothetical protein
MVFKLKSKTAYIYEFGTHRYILPKFKPVPTENMNELPFLAIKSDLYSQVRIIHNYRNISRAAKQFLLGDPIAEQLLVTMLRIEFLYPLKGIKSPIYNYLPIQRILADHTDRHYALVANNQHPVQLFLYEYLNKKYRKSQDLKDFNEGKAKPTYEIALDLKVKELIELKLKTKDVENGEVVSPDEIFDIYRDAVEDVQSRFNISSKTKGKTGEIEDFLETRRPFTNNKH